MMALANSRNHIIIPTMFTIKIVRSTNHSEQTTTDIIHTYECSTPSSILTCIDDSLFFDSFFSEYLKFWIYSSIHFESTSNIDIFTILCFKIFFYIHHKIGKLNIFTIFFEFEFDSIVEYFFEGITINFPIF